MTRPRNSILAEGSAPTLKIPAGMVEWHGETAEPPEDWDGGPYLCRDGGMYHMRGYGWRHGEGCWNPTADWDRIAYTPIAKATTPRAADRRK